MKTKSPRTKQNVKEQTVVSPLFDNSADAVLVVDAQHIVRYANQTAAKIFLTKISDLLSSPFRVPIADNERATIPLPIAGHQHRLGVVHTTDVTWNGTKAMLIVVHVLPESVEAMPPLHQNYEMLQYVLDASPVGISWADVRGNIKYVNRTFVELFGYTLSDIPTIQQWFEKTIPDIKNRNVHFDHYMALNKSAPTTDHENVVEKIELLCKDSRVRLVGIASKKYSDGVIATFNDLTGHRQVSDALEKERNLLRTLVDNLPDIINFKDTTGAYVLNNRAHLQLIGQNSQEDTLGKTVFDFHAPELAQQYFDDEMRVLQTGKPLLEKEELAIQNNTGEKRWHLTSRFPLIDSLGNVLGVFDVSRDITERKYADALRKRAEDALRESEERYRDLFERSPIGMYRITPDGVILIANPALLAMLQFSSLEELTNQNKDSDGFKIQYPPGIVNETFDDHQRIWGMESQWRRADGTTLYVRENGSIVRDEHGDIQYYEGTVEDITDRKLAEEKIQQRLRELTVLHEASRAFSTKITVQNAAQQVIDVLEHELGWKRASIWLIGKDEHQLELYAHTRLGSNEETFAKENNNYLHQTQSTDMGIIGWTIRYKQPARVGNVAVDTRYRQEDPTVQSELCVPLMVSSKIIGVINAEDDKLDGFTELDEQLLVTLANYASMAIRNAQLFEDLKHQLAEREVMNEELRKISRAIEQSPVSIVITDSKGNIEYVNPKFEEVTAYTIEEVRGKNPRILKSKYTSHEEYRHLWDTILAGNEWRGEFYNKKKTGEMFWESATISSIKDSAGAITHFLAVKEDITEKKRLNRELQQAQKMESLGTLAGGVAHDFNNILSIILGYTHLLQKQKDDPQKFSACIEVIKKSIDRGAGLVQQILTFARKSEIDLQPLYVNSVLADLSKMIGETFPKTIRMAFDLQKKLPVIRMDNTQFNQALLNLCVNARDAMQGKGELTVTTRIVSGEEILHHTYETQNKTFIRIAVSDTGCGMDEATRSRIFEPFFTTKEKGKGTGLGLAVVYGVVQAHNGFIQVESELGKGTTFKLYFPVSQEFNEEQSLLENPEQNMPGGSETILFVEDESALLQLGKMAMELGGYHVLTAMNGKEALRLYQEHAPEIDLVLTDIGLPEMSGAELVAELQLIHAKAKIIVTSGFLEPDMKTELFNAGIKEFIPKPFQIPIMLQKIRTVLDQN
ncbi:MAG TPA: PAS domain S-box protein [Bacteroidota bacterium]|nr:PAS domain S-box protein [Bacteroidota bacterium]